MHIPLNLVITVIVVVLIYVWLNRKSKGLTGTWNSKDEIEEFAYLITPVQNNNHVINNSPIWESQGEKICRSHLEHRFNVKFDRRRPDFLKNPITKNNLELDCFNEKLKLGLEYNGKQHYEYVPKFHKSKSDFHNQKYRDEIKKRLCYENGVDFIEVPYTINNDNIPSYIDAALEKLGRLKYTM